VSLAREAGLEVDDSHRRDDVSTAVCDIYVTPDGQRTMLGQGFSALAEGPYEEFDCRREGWFTTDSNLGGLGVRLLRYALSEGLATVATDYAHRPGTPPPATVHLTSIEWLRDDPAEWADRHGQTLIVTSGPAGSALAVPGQQVRLFPAYPALETVDTTGAGDCFRAGLLFGLQQGMALSHAMRFASAAAAMSVRALGATGGIPSRREVEEWMSCHPEVSAAYD
jgi:sugar/nucleoside kinase (ribokinase family)